METVELRIAPDEEPGLRRLRLRSFYTGTTYWRYGWGGSEQAALEFMDAAAELQGHNVGEESASRSGAVGRRAAQHSQASLTNSSSVPDRRKLLSQVWDSPKYFPTAKKRAAN